MVESGKVTHAVFDAVDEVNQQLPKGRQLEKSVDTVLYGESAELDSLGLINLIVATEQKIEEKIGVTITLADDESMSQKDSPFTSIGNLIDYISLLLERKPSG